ncbi:MAG: hypothetical protein ACRD8A_03330 [Candidatus Acidiferrales bacterium]
MRTAIISAFVAALGLVCVANPAAAQSRQNSAPSHLSLLPQSPFASAASSGTTTSASPGARNVFSPNVANALPSPKDQAKKSNGSGDQQWRIVPPKDRLQATNLPPADTCAHILIHRVWTPDSNPMVVKPNGSADRMPSAKGLPVCREDIR